MHFGTSCPKPGLDQILSDCRPMRCQPARSFDVCENECTDVVKGPQFSGASWGASAYPDGLKNERQRSPGHFKAASITNRSDRWQSAKRNVEKSGLSPSLASSTTIIIGTPHSGHTGISLVAS